MIGNGLFLVGSLLVLAAAIFWLTRRAQRRAPRLRAPDSSHRAQREVLAAVEDGKGVQFTLGRGGLDTIANPVSLAAASAASVLMAPASAADRPPVVSVGEGTLFSVAWDDLRRAYANGGRPFAFRPGLVHFLADSAHPEAYAAGVSYLLHRQRGGTNLALGRLGVEVAIISEAARRQRIAQVVGSDDVVGLAAAWPGSVGVMIGESLFAASAFLRGRPDQLAGLQLQDWLRLVVIIGLLTAAVMALMTGA